MRESIYTPLVSLVVPFYNEGEAVERFFDVVIPLLTAIDAIRFEIVCVNDGSRDDTLDRLIRISTAERRVRVIDLTRNFGKEAALTAGLDEAHEEHAPHRFHGDQRTCRTPAAPPGRCRA